MRYSKIILLGFLLNFVNVNTNEAISSSYVSCSSISNGITDNCNNNDYVDSSFYNDNIREQHNNSGVVTQLQDTNAKQNNTSLNNIIMLKKQLSSDETSVPCFNIREQGKIDITNYAKSSEQLYNMKKCNTLQCGLINSASDLSDCQQNNFNQNSNITVNNRKNTSKNSTCISPITNNNTQSIKDFDNNKSNTLILSQISQNNINKSNESNIKRKQKKQKQENKRPWTRIQLKNINAPSKFIDVTKLNENKQDNSPIKNKHGKYTAKNDQQIDNKLQIVINPNKLQKAYVTNNIAIVNSDKLDCNNSKSNNTKSFKLNINNNESNVEWDTLNNKLNDNNSSELKHSMSEINYVKEQVRKYQEILYPDKSREKIPDELIDNIITEMRTTNGNTMLYKVFNLLNQNKQIVEMSDAFYDFIKNITEYLYYVDNSSKLIKEQLIKDIPILLENIELQDGNVINEIYEYIYHGRDKNNFKKAKDELKDMLYRILHQESVMNPLLDNIQNRIYRDFVG